MDLQQYHVVSQGGKQLAVEHLSRENEELFILRTIMPS